ncbi:RNA recognition motif domain-containing protein [Thermodesulfobacteriota bacterium]
MSGINIYVGNLSFDAVEDELRELFEGYGPVDSAKIILDRFTGRSRGFGFVEMADREEGMKAIEALDSRDFKGRSLKVNEARPRRDAGGGGRRGGGGGGGGGDRRQSRW